MKLTHCLAISVLALSTRAPAQVTSDETKVSEEMHTARIVGVQHEISQLQYLAHSEPESTQIVGLRQRILEKVVAASLQVDATIAQIDNEIAQTNELRNYLGDKRDKSVNRANLLSVVAGGALGATSAGLQLPSGQNKSSSIVGIAAGVVASGLAISGMRAQKGARRKFDFNSNMLAQVFDRATLEDSHYASIPWTFLNDVAPSDHDGLTRKQRLIQTWIALKRMDSPSSPGGERKIGLVTSQPSDNQALTIEDLEDRAAMLDDVRAKVSFLKRDLARLLLSLPVQ